MTKKPECGKILIVEDNGRAADSLRQMINLFDLKTEIASDGSEAMKLLKENEYFLVIADTHMPGVSGFELLKHIKHNYPQTPIAVISIGDSASTRGIVATNRADFYLPKPLKMSDLEKVLSRAKERSQLR
jgi:DNA-binding response OmpR family regulator